MAGVNWPGLLSWSTRYHDGTAPSAFKEMSQEDRDFLEKAMEEAFGKVEDPNVVMAEAISQLKGSDATQDAIATALEVIDRCCDDPDCARNAEKLDGVQALLDLLKSQSGPLRTRTLEILALLFANNPSIQEAGARRGAMAILLSLLHDNGTDAEEQSKAFRALVALLRNSSQLEEAFLKEADGLSVLTSCLEPARDSRMREKAVSLTFSLANDNLLQAAELDRLAEAVATLIDHASNECLQYREMLASCAGMLAQKNCPRVLAEAVQKRVAELGAAKDPEGAVELSTLQDTLVAAAA